MNSVLKSIKTELDRAFRNGKMLWVLLAGCLISVLQIIVDVLPAVSNQESGTFTAFPFTVFEKYIGLIAGSVFPYYYYMFIPLAAAVPVALTAYTDRKSGYIKNVFTRTEKKNYYVAKNLAAFISAGVVTTVPQILNLLIVAALLPSIQPYPGIGYVGISSDAMWVDLFYAHAYFYIILYLVFNFIFYGLLNTFAVALSWFYQNWFAVLLTPFLTLQFLSFACKVFGQEQLKPENFLIPSQLMGNTSKTEILLLIVFFLVVSVLAIVYGVKKGNYYE